MESERRWSTSSGGRWYVAVLTALAALATVWGISEQAATKPKPAILVATER